MKKSLASFQALHRIRIWDPSCPKIRQRYFLKTEIVFGSDKNADIVVPDGPGFGARLDFESGELHYLEEEKISNIDTKTLFQVGAFVFQWTRVDWWKKEWNWAAGAFLGGLLLLSVCFLWKPASESAYCSPRFVRAAQGAWSESGARVSDKDFFQSLSGLKKSFQEALKLNQWAKARLELNSVREILGRENAPKDCGIFAALEEMEGRLSQRLVFEHLKKDDLVSAALEAQKSKQRISETAYASLEKRVIRAARKTYLDGYRLEEESPEKSEALMEAAHEACLSLSREAECFRSAGEEGQKETVEIR